MKRFYLLISLAVLVFAACSDQPSGPVPESDADMHKAVSQNDATGDVDLTSRYIVVFKESVGNVNATIDEMTRGSGSAVHYRYGSAIKGFCATIPPQAIEGIRHNPNVSYIEADGIMTANTVTQTPVPSWGIDRIDQPALPINNIYVYANDGTGVTVYIIDTGIEYNHVEFGNPSRASFGFDAWGGTGADQNGHGTHVSGTVGGLTVGVAKNVALVSVRVLDKRGSGTTSGVIAGVDWVTAHHLHPSVANMSLGGGFYQALNDAVANAVTHGVVFAVAAGNESTLASTKSPASEASAITVGATTSTDAFATYSNYGSVVDILAPGSSIYSSYYSRLSTSAYATLSGTSMATPHVAGAAALYLASNPGASPATVTGALLVGAVTPWISGLPGSTTNKLLNTTFIGGGTAGTPPTGSVTLAVSAASYSSIHLSWTYSANDASGFRIEHSADGVVFTTLATVGSATTSYDHTGLTASSTHYYRVYATNAYGDSQPSSVQSATTPVQPATTTVHIATATAVAVTVNRSNWAAEMTVTVTNGTSGVQGATVTMVWTGGAAGSSTAVTDVNGQAVLSTNPLNTKKVGSVNLDVASVTGTNLTYDASLNPIGILPINNVHP